MTNVNVDARRIRDAFEHDLSGLYASPGLAQRARVDGRRAVKRRRVRRVACVAAVACAASVTLVATTPWAGPAAPGTALANPGPGYTPPVTGPVSAAAKPSAAAVSRAMLTSFQAASGDIVYEREVDLSASGRVADETQSWSWPIAPVAGQQVHYREVDSEPASGAGRTMRVDEDWGAVFTYVPASPFAHRVPTSLTMVCPPSGGGCGYGSVQVPAGAWSRVTSQQPVPITDLTPGPGSLNPPDLARAIAQGRWRVLGLTRLNGQAAIKLIETAKGAADALPVLWVSARTHLPLLNEDARGDVKYFSYLPPTPANLAQLRVPIPAGYPRSGG
jgi:hypothetical protein